MITINYYNTETKQKMRLKLTEEGETLRSVAEFDPKLDAENPPSDAGGIITKLLMATGHIKYGGEELH